MPRLRDLGITIGNLPTGRFNAVTDVPGVTVGYATVISDAPRIARPRLPGAIAQPFTAGFSGASGSPAVHGWECPTAGFSGAIAQMSGGEIGGGSEGYRRGRAFMTHR